MDSDLSHEENNKQTLRTNGTFVFDWDSSNALEEQVFFDIPTETASKLLNLAKEKTSTASICDKLKNVGVICCVSDDEELSISEMDDETKKKIGTVAKDKNSGWYKRINLGEKLGNIVFECWGEIDDSRKLKKTVNALSMWVMKND